MNISFARLFMENRKKQGSLDSFLCSKAKEPKLQLNEEPDKVKETGTPVEAEKPTQRRFQQSWKTKYVWLKYDEAKNAIYVLQFLCQDNGKANLFTAGNSISEQVRLKGMLFIVTIRQVFLRSHTAKFNSLNCSVFILFKY